MPELPEVETIARDLQACLPGQRVAGALVFWPRTVAAPEPAALSARIAGQTVRAVGRRGKFLRLSLSEDALILHLRMTGRLVLADCFPAGSAPPDPYVRVALPLESGQVLAFHDVRKFGRLWLVRDPAEVLGRLGPEPLDDALTPERLHGLLGGRRRRLKDLLLDQTVIAGLGNIYVDEALWEARLSPRRRGNSLTPAESAQLHGAVRRVLERSIAARGTTLRDYRDPHNVPGANQALLQVYGRAGSACGRCGAPIVRAIVAGRSTHWCPVCQGPDEAREDGQEGGGP